MSRKSRAAARSRPTWIPLAVTAAVIAVALAGIAIYAATRPSSAAPVDRTGVVVAKVTNVSPAVLDAVGTGGVKNPLRPPAVAQSPVPGRPSILYVGAEYCPYCASERWSLVVALSRFGTFDGLKLSSSSSSDVYPNTATLSFHGSTYRSSYLDFTAVETADREGRPLEPMPADATAVMKAQNPSGGIPFVSLGSRWFAAGSAYPPDTLSGQDWMRIADALQDANSPTARAVLGNAAYLTAGICRVTDGQPASVCGSSGVRAADAAIR